MAGSGSVSLGGRQLSVVSSDGAGGQLDWSSLRACPVELAGVAAFVAADEGEGEGLVGYASLVKASAVRTSGVIAE